MREFLPAYLTIRNTRRKVSGWKKMIPDESNCRKIWRALASVNMWINIK